MESDAGTDQEDPRAELWSTTYDGVLYDVWMEELVNAWLLRFWTHVNIAGSFLAAVTSTGSAVAVWPLWGHPGAKVIWGIIAGCAAVSSLFLAVFKVPDRIKSLGEFHSEFLRLRLNVEAFSQDIDGMELQDARKRFRELRDEGHKLIANAPPDIAPTKRTREKIQEELNSILITEGYAE